ncbi:MAG: hypothetical protein V2I63_10165 [Pseudomonadales bacterium]|nr:hypothetical protein [Pseudomonadales bacterium]
MIIDGTRASFIDHGIVETIADVRAAAHPRGVEVERERNSTGHNALFSEDGAA